MPKITDNKQRLGFLFPMPKIEELLKEADTTLYRKLVQDQVWISFAYKGEQFSLRLVNQGAAFEFKGALFEFAGVEPCIAQVLALSTHAARVKGEEATDIGLAEVVCYAGAKIEGPNLSRHPDYTPDPDRAPQWTNGISSRAGVATAERDFLSLYTEYCQKRMVINLNHWLPFLSKECLGKDLKRSELSAGKRDEHSAKAHARRLSSLEANAYQTMGICALLHWPLERAMAERRAQLASATCPGPCAKCQKRAKEAEWSAVHKAAKCFAIASEAGHAGATYHLGLLKEAGFANAQDMQEAQEWLDLKAQQDHARKKTLKDFNKVAHSDAKTAKRGARDCRLVGCGSSSDCMAAWNFYAEARHQGLVRAASILGLRELQSCRTAGRQDSAHRLLSSCASKDSAAMFGLGLSYLFHGGGAQTEEGCGKIEARRKQAYDCFRKAARLGHSRASFNAAMCRKYGIGCNEDAPSGLRWEHIGAAKPPHGHELTNSKLQHALEKKTTFTPKEAEDLEIGDLGAFCFIKSGDSYFKPADTSGDAEVRESLRIGVDKRDVRCMMQLALYHLESDFPHAYAGTGIRLLHEVWRLGKGSDIGLIGAQEVPAKLAEVYGEGRLVDKDLRLAGAWLSRIGQERHNGPNEAGATGKVPTAAESSRGDRAEIAPILLNR